MQKSVRMCGHFAVKMETINSNPLTTNDKKSFRDLFDVKLLVVERQNPIIANRAKIIFQSFEEFGPLLHV
jgi:hypothetical protein